MQAEGVSYPLTQPLPEGYDSSKASPRRGEGICVGCLWHIAPTRPVPLYFFSPPTGAFNSDTSTAVSGFFPE